MPYFPPQYLTHVWNIFPATMSRIPLMLLLYHYDYNPLLATWQNTLHFVAKSMFYSLPQINLLIVKEVARSSLLASFLALVLPLRCCLSLICALCEPTYEMISVASKFIYNSLYTRPFFVARPLITAVFDVRILAPFSPATTISSNSPALLMSYLSLLDQNLQQFLRHFGFDRWW